MDVVREQGLVAGDKLPSIRELADMVGVKASLVRDALLQAQAKGLVRILPRAGAFLQPHPTASTAEPLTELSTALAHQEHNVFHMLDARRLLDMELAGRAAKRRHLEDLLPARQALEAMISLPESEPRSVYVDHDIRFHVEIARLAGNSVLFVLLRTLMEMLRPYLIKIQMTPERRHRTDSSHATIYASLVAGDVEKTRAEMRNHLSMAYDSMLLDLQEPPRLDEPTNGSKEDGQAG
jgi:GntR family transcriptional repressor for pyruvate dehydrogenase complex